MPLSLIIEICLSSFMGAAVGWITNAIAIDMLFKKYWKWGGVIEDNYQEFIENMSRLVEEDLVNSRTLQQEFTSPGFREVLYKWVEDIIQKELPANSGNLRLEEIPGIEASMEGIISLVEGIQPALLEGISKTIIGEKIKTLVSKEQYTYLVDTNVKNIFSNQVSIDAYGYTIKKTLDTFLQDKTLNEIIPDQVIYQVKENIQGIIQKTDFSKYAEDWDRAWQDMLGFLGIDPLIKELEQRVGRMGLSDFVGPSKKIPPDLIKKALDLVSSAEGQGILAGLISSVLQDARKIPLTIGKLLHPSIKEGIADFCTGEMPGILDRIADFIRDSQAEIEELINKTLDKQLNRSLWGTVLKSIQHCFTENVAGQYHIIDRIIKAIHNYRDKAGRDISNQLINLLETKTIGEVLGYIQDSGILDIPSIVTYINKHLKDLENRDFIIPDTLMNRTIGETIGEVDLSILTKKLLPVFFDRIKQEYLYGEGFKRDTCSNITAKADILREKKISPIFNIHEINIPLNPEKIKNTLHGLWDAIADTSIGGIIGKERVLPKIKRSTLRGLWGNHKKQELNQFYRRIQSDRLYSRVTDGIIAILKQNLDMILTGNVSALVNRELSKLRPGEINTMVQDFMGREMRSINILGAVLGFIIGGISAVTAYLAGVPSNFLWWMLGVYGGIFAFAGISTNWLAIKMLFRPYRGLFKGAKFPPFIGIVAARKPEFAKNIAVLVKQRILNDEALGVFFISNKERVQELCFKKVSDENYAILDSFFSDPEGLDYLSRGILQGIHSSITAHPTEIANTLAERIKGLVEGDTLYSLIPTLGTRIMEKLKERDTALWIAHLISQEIGGKYLGSSTRVMGALADPPLQRILGRLMQRLIQELTLDKVKTLLSNQKDQFTSYIIRHTMADLLGSQGIDRFTKKITDHITDTLLDSSVLPIVKMLQEECNPNKRLDEPFGGALSELLKKNIRFMSDMIVRQVGNTREVLIEDIKKSLNPLTRLAIGGQIAPIVNTLLDQEFPQFLHRKQDQLGQIVETLGEKKLSSLGFTDTSWETEILKGTIAFVFQGSQVKQGVSHFVSTLIQRISALPLQQVLHTLHISRIEDLFPVLEPLLSDALGYMRNNLSKDEIIQEIAGVIKGLGIKLLKDLSIAELLDHIEVEKELARVLEKLIGDEKAGGEISGMIETALRSIVRDPSFYNDPILQRDMAAFIPRLGNAENLDYLQQGIKELLLHINGALVLETKNALCNEYLIRAIINAGTYNFSNIIHSLDVQRVVEGEIHKMHPSGIEKLFYKFAGSYFTKITWYGWIGLFGGLLSYALGCLLNILYR